MSVLVIKKVELRVVARSAKKADHVMKRFVKRLQQEAEQFEILELNQEEEARVREVTQ